MMDCATFTPDTFAALPDHVPSGNEILGVETTEDGVARFFAARYRDALRFDHHRGLWYQWTGTHWAASETGIGLHLARELARAVNVARDEGLATARFAAAVERLARHDPTLACTSDIWDRDPFLLATPAGTVDLHTGRLRPADPMDFATKTTAVAPADRPDCQTWLKFIQEVTRDNPDLIRFMMQVAGYSLTGDTREQSLFFVFGDGGNGKGVFLNTITKVMGGYAVVAAMDTFQVSQGDKHPTELARLKGARLVTASETEEGRAWAENRIKLLTGNDRITARFMRQDFFEFDPQFKLLIIGNHQPVLRNVDDAHRRRFNMIPFTFKPPVKDVQLEEKLKSEWPGILRWMINGCLDWQKNGLVRPAVVIAANEEYFGEQDTVQQWIDAECETGNVQDTTERLFASWMEWNNARNEKPGTAKRFSQTLQKHGFEPIRNPNGMRDKKGFKGVKVREREEQASYTRNGYVDLD